MDSVRKSKKRVLKESFKGPQGKKRRAEYYKKLTHKKKSSRREELEDLKRRYQTLDPSTVEKFADLPLSKLTLQGLTASDYSVPTEIQRDAICLALQGKDIVGSAKTGSGKTLAFLVPLLELLYRQQWGHADGLGALVISPTRELALQTFQVLKRIGRFHSFSAGCIIGGLHLKAEAERIHGSNIIICTPGRLLDHIEGFSNIHTSNLQMLVLDETDMMIEEGFMEGLTSILEYLPKERQTLLFSATQTVELDKLAKIGLRQAWIASAHVLDPNMTPSQLNQNYIVCDLEKKMSMLYSFLSTHARSKILVFMNCCKQVRFVAQVMHKLLQNRTILAVHSKIKQTQRVDAYTNFNRKQHAILFATDIAARGLDFPSVQWVVQLDCPESVKQYIHRVGRTARNKHSGEALLMLTPSEVDFIKLLQKKNIPISCIKVKTNRTVNITPKLKAMLVPDVQLMEFAKQAYVAYLQHYSLLPNKSIFNVDDIDRDAFAESFGLSVTPRVSLRQANEMRKEKEAAKGRELVVNALAKLQAASQKRRKNDSDEEDNIENIASVSETLPSDASSVGHKQENGLVEDSELEEDASPGAKDSEETEGSGESENSDLSSLEIHQLVPNTVLKVSKSTTSKAKQVFDSSSDDDDDDEFIKHRKKTPEVIQSIEDDQISSKKASRVTKIGLAKRFLKKHIVPNTKIVFDEEGMPVRDHFKPGQDLEPGAAGRINVISAKKLMEAEDKADKAAYALLVKAKHKKERLKKREENLRKKGRTSGANEQDAEVVLGSSGDVEDEVDEDGDSGEDDLEPRNKRRKMEPDLIPAASNSSDDDDSSDSASIDKTSSENSGAATDASMDSDSAGDQTPAERQRLEDLVLKLLHKH